MFRWYFVGETSFTRANEGQNPIPRLMFRWFFRRNTSAPDIHGQDYRRVDELRAGKDVDI